MSHGMFAGYRSRDKRPITWMGTLTEHHIRAGGVNRPVSGSWRARKRNVITCIRLGTWRVQGVGANKAESVGPSPCGSGTYSSWAFRRCHTLEPELRGLVPTCRLQPAACSLQPPACRLPVPSAAEECPRIEAVDGEANQVALAGVLEREVPAALQALADDLGVRVGPMAVQAATRSVVAFESAVSVLLRLSALGADDSSVLVEFRGQSQVGAIGVQNQLVAGDVYRAAGATALTERGHRLALGADIDPIHECRPQDPQFCPLEERRRGEAGGESVRIGSQRRDQVLVAQQFSLGRGEFRPTCRRPAWGLQCWTCTVAK